MKAKILFLFVVSVASIVGAQAVNWHQTDQTQFYGLLVSCAVDDAGQIGRFSETIDEVKLALVDCNIVLAKNVNTIYQPTWQNFKDNFFKLVGQASDDSSDVLIIPLNTHRGGYSIIDQTLYGRVQVHNDPQGEIDAREDTLALRVFRHIVWMQEVSAIPLDQMKIEFSIKEKMVDSTWAGTLSLDENKLSKSSVNSKNMFVQKVRDEQGAEVVFVQNNEGIFLQQVDGEWVKLNFTIFNCYGVKLVPVVDNLSIGQRCSVREEHYLIGLDSDWDGLIYYCSDPSYDEQYNQDWHAMFGEIKAGKGPDELVTGIMFDSLDWDKDRQFDFDRDGLLDEVFVEQTIDGPRMVAELESGGNLQDTSNDGVFDRGDLNGDGDQNDFINWVSLIRFADRLVPDYEFGELLSFWPGIVWLIDGSCYGGDQLDDLSANVIGWSFISKFYTTSLGYMRDFANYIRQLHMTSVVGRPGRVYTALSLLNTFVKGIWGEDGEGTWLEDNGDKVATKAPCYPETDQDDGALARKIVLFQTFETTGVEEVVVADEFKLNQNYPNFFNPITTIEYFLPKNCKVSLKIYNVSGQEVAELINTQQLAGNYLVIFDGSNFASGQYFYRLTAGEFIEMRKMILVK